MPSESPGTDLHALIHALQPMEKRYFKLFASRMGQDRAKKYLQLYDFLLQQPAWSETAVRAAFPGEAFLRQLNVACLYLYDLLLASLRGYDQDRTAVSECGRRLDEVALLYERKLAGPCMRRIQSARRLAERLDLPQFHLQLLDYEIRLYRGQGGKSDWQAMEAAILRSQALAEQVRMEAALNGLYSRLFALETWPTPHLHADRFVLLAKLAADPLLACDPAALAFDARLLFYKIQFLLAKARHDKAALLDSHAQKLACWDAHPHRISLAPERYLQALHSYIDYAIEADVFEHVPAALRKMQVLVGRPSSYAAQYRPRYLHLDLRYHMSICDFEGALRITEAVWEDLARPQGQPLPAGYITLYVNAALVHYIMMSWRGCLSWLAQLDHLRKGGLRIELSLIAGGMRLVALYAAGEFDALESATRAWRRNTDAGALAPLLADAFDALNRSQSIAEERACLLRLGEALAEPAQHPQVAELCLNWVRAKLEERSLRSFYAGRC
jgi:hypothetical protein